MASPPDNEIGRLSVPETIDRLSHQMLGLAPGPLAELRRMEVGGIGAPAYWRLAANCTFLDRNSRTWMQITKIMAILTPKGERTGNERLHQRGGTNGRPRPLGAVLCDGGDPAWPRSGESVHDGVLSEKRLARFLATPPAARGASLERIATMLASKRDPNSGLDCVDIANLLLYLDDQEPPRRLAREYYRRLDRVVRTNQKGEAGQ